MSKPLPRLRVFHEVVQSADLKAVARLARAAEYGVKVKRPRDGQEVFVSGDDVDLELKAQPDGSVVARIYWRDSTKLLVAVFPVACSAALVREIAIGRWWANPWATSTFLGLMIAATGWVTLFVVNGYRRETRELKSFLEGARRSVGAAES